MTLETGTTTRQMEEAPKGAVFIWCNGDLKYPRRLAHDIGREDLQIKAPTWLEDRWRGLEITGLVVDHAASLTHNQLDGYLRAITRVRRTLTEET